MVLFHKRYDLPNETNINVDDFTSSEEFVKILKEEYNAVVILPVFMYDHSGVAFSTVRSHPFNDPWDAGQVGFIFADRAAILDNFTGYRDGKREPMKRRINRKMIETTIHILEREVETYNKWSNGSVMCFTTYQLRGDEYLEIESLGGCHELEDMVHYVPKEFRKRLLAKQFD